MKTTMAAIFAVALIAGGIAYFYFYGGKASRPIYRVAQLQSGKYFFTKSPHGPSGPEKLVYEGPKFAGQL